MKLKKRIHKGICAAEKCNRKEGLYTVTIEGRNVQMCGTCAVASPDEGGGGVDAYEAPAVISDVPNDGDFEAQTLVATEFKEACELLDALNDYAIQTDDDVVNVKKVMDDVKAKYKALEAKKQSITKPMLVSLEAARDLFRPAQEVLQKAEALLKRKIIEYDTRLKEAREAAIAAMHVAETVEEQEELMKTIAHEPPKVEGLVRRVALDYKIVDASQVPGIYWSIDHAKIKDAISRGVIQIQGVEIFHVEQIASRATS